MSAPTTSPANSASVISTLENGKYGIAINHVSGAVTLQRHGQDWISDPVAPKMLIAAAYELESLRGRINDLERELAVAQELAELEPPF